MLCHCGNKQELFEIDIRFGNIRKKYSCSNGHRRDVIKDGFLIEFIDYNPKRKKLIYQESLSNELRLSGRRYKGV